MTKTKSTKRALLMSALSLLMCVSMLIGSTFAWFTDSVTSAGNKIQSGTLKVDLELLDKETNTWNSIKESKAPIFNYDKWEPGYTDVKILKVENEGTLALKWYAKFVSNETLGILADVIDVYVCPSETDALSYPAGRDLTGYKHVGTLRDFVNTIETTTYGQLDAGKSAYLGIALKMQESADNTYQNQTLGTFDIQILATQNTVEADSFNNQYDEDAPHTLVTTADELVAAVAEGGLIMLKEDIALSDILVISKDGTVINGDGNKLTSTAGRAINVSGTNGVIIKDLTVECSGERAVDVIQNSTDVTIDGCTLTANNYTINVASSAPNAVVAIKNSTLTGHNVVNVAAEGADVTVADSTVNLIDNSANEGYGALYLNKDATNGKITATDTAINISGSNTDYSSKGLLQAEGGVITIDGSTEDVIVEVAYIDFGDNWIGCRTLQDALESEDSNDQTIVLIRDIELDETVTIPAGKTVTIDLNGHDIVATSTSNENAQLFSVSGNLEIVGKGTISLTNPNFAWNTSYRYTAIEIRETGVVTLGEGVSVICTAGENTAKGYGMTYAVDIYKTGTLNVNGASLNSNYIAVRCFYGASTVNFNSGSITSSYPNANWGIWPQAAEGAKITIADGIDYTVDEYGIYIFN